MGALFLLALDSLMPHLHPGSTRRRGCPARLVKAPYWSLPSPCTIFLKAWRWADLCSERHGVSDAAAPGVAVASALALSLGMGLQELSRRPPSLPLRQEGFSKTKSFALGALSGIVEPIGGILAVLIAGAITPLMPWFLSFAAGAMIYVVVEELIPEAHLGEHSNAGTIGVLAGFVIMMILDVALG